MHGGGSIDENTQSKCLEHTGNKTEMEKSVGTGAGRTSQARDMEAFAPACAALDALNHLRAPSSPPTVSSCVDKGKSAHTHLRLCLTHRSRRLDFPPSSNKIHHGVQRGHWALQPGDDICLSALLALVHS
jgi:hypothetical protein